MKLFDVCTAKYRDRPTNPAGKVCKGQ